LFSRVLSINVLFLSEITYIKLA